MQNFHRCDDCVDLSSNPPVYKRCQHEKDKSPSLSYSKMGAVLHLVWRKVLRSDDGSMRDFKLDVDFICPMIPVSRPEHYNDSEARRDFLIKSKPVGWLDELAKITNIEDINIERFENWTQYVQKVDCRLKLISPKSAISIHAEPYLREEAISGARKKIYLALKILKEATGAKATSYQLKTALLKVFRRQPTDINIGEAVLKVFNQETNFRNIKDQQIHTIGDLFNGIQSNLGRKGFTGLDLSRLGEGFVILKKENQADNFTN